MFFHGYHSYMVSSCSVHMCTKHVSCFQHLFVFMSVHVQNHAYPADELMPLTCKGRIRGQDRGRGDIDDALGR